MIEILTLEAGFQFTSQGFWLQKTSQNPAVLFHAPLLGDSSPAKNGEWTWRWAKVGPTSYKQGYGAPINGLINW